MPHKDREAAREYARQYARRRSVTRTITCSECGNPYTYTTTLSGGYYVRRYCASCFRATRRATVPEDAIRHFYLDWQLPITEVAKRLDTTAYIVRQRLVEGGIPRRKRQGVPRHPRPVSPCKQCGTPVPRLLSQRKPNGVFCTKECFDIWQAVRDETVRYGKGWAEAQRKARERDKACQGCGKTAEEVGRALDVHHKTPMRLLKDKADAHNLDNLICFCPSCHTTADLAIRWAKPHSSSQSHHPRKSLPKSALPISSGV